MTFDAFIETAWNDHADRPQEVADRLAAAFDLVDDPERVPPFARLLTHVYGEHLGQWQRGIDLLESLREHSRAIGDAATNAVLTRSVATLRYAGGDRASLAGLPPEDGVAVLASAASALAGRNNFAGAISAYSDALQRADAGLPAKSPAIRALAVGGNNLAVALEQKMDRSAAETAGMVGAALGALKYWKQAGTWLEEERAEYRLARSLLQAGDANAALRSARRCIEVCEANAAPAFELFFAHSALALAQRAAGELDAFDASRQHAAALFGQVPEDERTRCEAELKALQS
jgi:tetratricopeptide (TPR) repeat protein